MYGHFVHVDIYVPYVCLGCQKRKANPLEVESLVVVIHYGGTRMWVLDSNPSPLQEQQFCLFVCLMYMRALFAYMPEEDTGSHYRWCEPLCGCCELNS